MNKRSQKVRKPHFWVLRFRVEAFRFSLFLVPASEEVLRTWPCRWRSSAARSQTRSRSEKPSSAASRTCKKISNNQIRQKMKDLFRLSKSNLTNWFFLNRISQKAMMLRKKFDSVISVSCLWSFTRIPKINIQLTLVLY